MQIVLLGPDLWFLGSRWHGIGQLQLNTPRAPDDNWTAAIGDPGTALALVSAAVCDTPPKSILRVDLRKTVSLMDTNEDDLPLAV